jgi:uncharacterized protein
MISYRCPTCGRIIAVARREEAPWRPFCCQRCQLIDLGKWLSGEYVVSEPLEPSGPDPASPIPPSGADRP